MAAKKKTVKKNDTIGKLTPRSLGKQFNAISAAQKADKPSKDWVKGYKVGLKEIRKNDWVAPKKSPKSDKYADGEAAGLNIGTQARKDRRSSKRKRGD